MAFGLRPLISKPHLVLLQGVVSAVRTRGPQLRAFLKTEGEAISPHSVFKYRGIKMSHLQNGIFVLMLLIACVSASAKDSLSAEASKSGERDKKGTNATFSMYRLLIFILFQSFPCFPW